MHENRENSAKPYFLCYFGEVKSRTAAERFQHNNNYYPGGLNKLIKLMNQSVKQSFQQEVSKVIPKDAPIVIITEEGQQGLPDVHKLINLLVEMNLNIAVVNFDTDWESQLKSYLEGDRSAWKKMTQSLRFFQ